jgi:membrane-bound lytic murein transglycosylase D
MMNPSQQAVAMIRRVLTAAWVGVVASAPVTADPGQFPRPDALEPDVRFWERVYSKVTTHGGLLHDDRHLEIVYEELNFPPGLSSKERSALVDTVRAHYERILRRLGTGAREDLSDDEARVLALYPTNVSDATLTEAADHLRFQLGQADRFREGLVRAGAWEKHVEDTLKREGLPGELSALPHVESSFNPRAYSKVGAAGLWQFMRSTGKRWLRVDNTVDERLDPYKSTLAAAQFLNINYTILGTWPLALTAWNHGAGGMRRAKDELGTDDITTIVRNYQGRTFGFASRNFYVSFLAALEVDRNAERYFGRIDRQPHDESRTVRLPNLMPAQALEKTLGTDRETLRTLNLALLDPVWTGRRPVPRGFELRVPAGVDPGRLLAHLNQSARDDATRERTVTVGKGETLDRIATQYGLRARELADYNHVSARDVRAGTTLRIPSPGTVAGPVSDQGTAGDAPPATQAPAPVAESHAATSVEVAPDPSTASARVHVVARGESLTAIARAQGVSTADLMKLNELSRPDRIREGQTLRLPARANVAVPTSEVSARVAADTRRPVAAAVGASEGGQIDDPGTLRHDGPVMSADPADYGITNGYVVVQAAETVGQLAHWAGVTSERLLNLNHLKAADALVLGRRLQMELVGVDAAEFESRRVEYHRGLEAAYFEHHRIVGTERHRLRAGETVWMLTRRDQIPVWLLRQYNPDVDFSVAKPGAEIVLPRVEPVAGDNVTEHSQGESR